MLKKAGTHTRQSICSRRHSGSQGRFRWGNAAPGSTPSLPAQEVSDRGTGTCTTTTEVVRPEIQADAVTIFGLKLTILVVAGKIRRYGMAPAHIMLFLSQNPGNVN